MIPKGYEAKFCDDFFEQIGWDRSHCCDSCHDDRDQGYMDMAEFPGEPYSEVCCAVLRAHEALTQASS